MLANSWLLVLFAFITMPVPEVRAEHGSPLLLVKPASGAEIPRNAQIRLVSYNGEHWLIDLLARSPHEVRARLESTGSVVPLRPRRHFTDHDGYGRAMISLVPKRLLKPKTEYKLVVEVPADDLREELATFVTSREIDRAAPRWKARPRFDRADHAFVGELAAYDDLIEVALVVRPATGGRARRTFVLFDLAQQCIEGPTADYNVAIFNSQCVDESDQEREGAICDRLYYFPGWRRERARYVVRIELRDLAGNVRRLGRLAGRIRLAEPLGLCLETGPGS